MFTNPATNSGHTSSIFMAVFILRDLEGFEQVGKDFGVYSTMPLHCIIFPWSGVVGIGLSWVPSSRFRCQDEYKQQVKSDERDRHLGHLSIVRDCRV